MFFLQKDIVSKVLIRTILTSLLPPCASEQGKVIGVSVHNDIIIYTVEPPRKGHFGELSFVLFSEVVLISETSILMIIMIHTENETFNRSFNLCWTLIV